MAMAHGVKRSWPVGVHLPAQCQSRTRSGS